MKSSEDNRAHASYGRRSTIHAGQPEPSARPARLRTDDDGEPATTVKPREKALSDVETVWGKVTPELKAELLAFWEANRAITDETQALRRAEQAVCVARGEDGTLCAVSTAVLAVLPRMAQPLYYYRLFFAESVRGQDQVFPFYNAGCRALEQYNASLPAPESLGVVLELESPRLNATAQRAYIAEVESVFIGYSPRGFQLRVTYFANAMLLPIEAVQRAIGSVQ